MVPYVWTNASQGVLHGIQGFQDVTLAAKWNFLDRPWTSHGALQAFFVVSGGIADDRLQPGAAAALHRHGKHARLVARDGELPINPGWFVNGTTAYTWRSDVGLDRPYFFTDGEFVMSDEVDMPNVLDTTARAGYMKRGLMTPSRSRSNERWAAATSGDRTCRSCRTGWISSGSARW